MTSSSQAVLQAQRRSTSALVAQYLRELADPRPRRGTDEGRVGVIPNGAQPAEAAP
jgi:hypothetical protein